MYEIIHRKGLWKCSDPALSDVADGENIPLDTVQRVELPTKEWSEMECIAFGAALGLSRNARTRALKGWF